MSLVNINSGVGTIGNSSGADFDLSVLDNNDNINTFKTLINSEWKSWSRGVPAAYQGFGYLKSGFGYVYSATDTVGIDFGDTTLDINSLNLTPGVALIAFPYNSKSIADGGYIPRLSVATVKTINNTWKSWSRGVPGDYQGFSVLTQGKGYVVKIDEVFDNYIDKNTVSDDSGVILGAVINTTNSSNIPLISGLDNSFIIKEIMDDNLISVDTSLTKKNMLIDINGVSSVLNFPREFLGKQFVIAAISYTVIDLGKINEAATKPTLDMGHINEASTKLTDLGTLGDVQLAISGKHIYTFVENNSSTPTEEDYYIIDDIIEIMYDKVSYNQNVNKKIMNLNLDGVLTRLSFATEYTGKSFVIIKDNVKYSGTFTESSTFMAL